ncbi:MAG: MFS transporter, partial [Myxococcota bacterium]
MSTDGSSAMLRGLRAWWPWGVTVLFVLWQVDFQFIYGFVAEPIQKELGLTASQAAAVSSVYLLSYGLMQLPAGWLLDRFSIRWLLPLMAAFSALSVFFFARSEDYSDLLWGRIMAGTFMAFAFPASGKIARMRLPANRFALAMALADMCFGVGAVLAGGLPGLFGDVEWRELMRWLGAIGLGLSILVWISLGGVGKEQSTFQPENLERGSVIQLLRRRSVFLGLLLYIWGAGLTFGFGGYWNLKLQESCGCTAPQVSEISTGL